jgi:hypothetical protein
MIRPQADRFLVRVCRFREMPKLDQYVPQVAVPIGVAGIERDGSLDQLIAASPRPR